MSISTILPPATVMPPDRISLAAVDDKEARGAVDQHRTHDR